MKNLFTLALAILFLTPAEAQFQTTQVITGLQYPVAFTFTPQNRIFLTLKTGQIMYYDANFSQIGTFYNLYDSTYNNFERGLLGIEVDPDYTNNKYVYVYYNHRCCNPSPTGSQFLRVVRFTEVANVGTNPTIILSIPVSNSIPGNHVGGNIRFRPSDPNHIYVSIGELAAPANSQLLTNPFGKILRIHKSGTIPTDNPYYDDGNPSTGNDDRIWTWGHRNPFDFAFSTFNDSLYISENGASTWDELNYGIKGRNYGWQACEGNFVYQSASPCSNPAYTNPIAVWGSPLPAVTGVLHYTSNVIPSLTNHLLVADNDVGYVHDLTLGNAPFYDVVTNQAQLIDLTTSGGLTTLKQGSEGCFYAMKGGYTTTGNITRVCPIGMYSGEALGIIPEFEVSPNPSSGEFNTRFFMNSAGQITLSVIDITGAQIHKASHKGKNGENAILMDLRNVPAGLYLVQINSGAEMHTRKLMISK